MRRMRYLVGDERAADAGPIRVRAALCVGGDVRPIEGAVDDQLAAALEQVQQAHGPIRPLEAVGLLHCHPRHTPTLSRHRVARPGELFLLHQQLLSGRIPLSRRDDRGYLHSLFLLSQPLIAMFSPVISVLICYSSFLGMEPSLHRLGRVWTWTTSQLPSMTTAATTNSLPKRSAGCQSPPRAPLHSRIRAPQDGSVRATIIGHSGPEVGRYGCLVGPLTRRIRPSRVPTSPTEVGQPPLQPNRSCLVSYVDVAGGALPCTIRAVP